MFEIWRSILAQGSVIVTAAQIAFLVLVLFGNVAFHILRQKRNKKELQLYGEPVDDKPLCQCGRVQQSCEWCKEDDHVSVVP